MKKWIAVLLAVLIGLQVSAWTCWAEDSDDPADSVADEEDPGDLEDPTEPTDSEDPTEPTDPASSFEGEVLTYQITGNTLTVIYTTSDGSSPKAATAGGTSIALKSVANMTAELDASKVPFGTSVLTLYFDKGSLSCTISRSGSTATDLTLSVSGTHVLATLVDSLGNPVVNCQLTLTVDNVQYAPQRTDSNGQVNFANCVPSAGYTSISCVSAPMTNDGVIYNSSSASLGEAVVSTTNSTTTTSGSKTSSTTETTTSTSANLPTAGDTTSTVAGTTYATVAGSTTTSPVGDTAVNVDVITDTNLLALFGLDIDTFNAGARLQMEQNVYSALSETYLGSIYANFYTSSVVATAEMVQTAIAGQDQFSQVGEDIQTLSVDISLQVINEAGGLDSTILAPALGTPALYVITMPVPTFMKDCTSFAVALAGTDALYNIAPVTVDNGTITFTISSFDSYTLVGFSGEAAEADTSTSKGLGALGVLLIVLIVFGVLLIAAAVVLVVLMLRRKNDDEEESTNGLIEEEGLQELEEVSDENDADMTLFTDDAAEAPVGKQPEVGEDVEPAEGFSDPEGDIFQTPAPQEKKQVIGPADNSDDFSVFDESSQSPHQGIDL